MHILPFVLHVEASFGCDKILSQSTCVTLANCTLCVYHQVALIFFFFQAWHSLLVINRQKCTVNEGEKYTSIKVNHNSILWKNDMPDSFFSWKSPMNIQWHNGLSRVRQLPDGLIDLTLISNHYKPVIFTYKKIIFCIFSGIFQTIQLKSTLWMLKIFRSEDLRLRV